MVFFGLLRDLFPGLDPPRVVDADLEWCVGRACRNLGLYADDVFCLKALQLDELLAIRHCVFVMGPAGAFKSSAETNTTGVFATHDN